MNREIILKIEDLSVTFTRYEGGFRQMQLQAIRNLDVTVKKGEIVAVVGASGSGKSLLAHAILGVLPANCSVRGIIEYDGERLTAERIKELRGKQIGFVPQSVTHLDPLKKAGAQVRGIHGNGESRRRQRTLFSRYGLPDEAESLYPFELSGGMARRVLISAAMMGSPRLIIADEPTPGLHLSAAKNVLKYFRSFADEGNAVLLITHDIDLALETADRVAVFYGGTTLEEAWASDFQSEDALRHPYTKALWRALPQNGFVATPGVSPAGGKLPSGCVFGPRCPMRAAECQEEIAMREIRKGRVRCLNAR